MANGVKALGVSRSADAPALACHPMTAHSRARVHDDERVPWWFILIPLGALAIIGLLVISLWRIAPAPSPAQRTWSPGADADVHVPVPDDLDTTERMMRFGPAFSR
jgi:hypothetical protein